MNIELLMTKIFITIIIIMVMILSFKIKLDNKYFVLHYWYFIQTFKVLCVCKIGFCRESFHICLEKL